MIAVQPTAIRPAYGIQAGLILLVFLLPGVEATNVLNTGFGLLGLLIFTLITRQFESRNIASLLAGAAGLLPRSLLTLMSDLGAMRVHSRSMNVQARGAKVIGNWVFPILLSLIFLSLFVVANPVLEGVIANIDLRAFLSYFEGSRLVFWIVFGASCWGFLRVVPGRCISPKPNAPEAAGTETQPVKRRWMSEAEIIRALLLFNVLFAAQTVLDLTYLWGGVHLPDGLTYADYAHRGAYALIATALLAAAFVLYAARDGAGQPARPFKQMLLLLWTGQNVILVLSSVLRLSLYVDVYALTYWRVAAFIWMMIVFAGLVLIGVRILAKKTNRWLISGNLWVLVVALYVTGFINVPAFIAQHNVSLALSGKGAGLDTHYLLSLGEEAIPAIDRLLNRPIAANRKGFSMSRRSNWNPVWLKSERDRLAGDFNKQYQQWRLWSLRRQHLKHYLDDYQRKQTNRPETTIY